MEDLVDRLRELGLPRGGVAHGHVDRVLLPRDHIGPWGGVVVAFARVAPELGHGIAIAAQLAEDVEDGGQLVLAGLAEDGGQLVHGGAAVHVRQLHAVRGQPCLQLVELGQVVSEAVEASQHGGVYARLQQLLPGDVLQVEDLVKDGLCIAVLLQQMLADLR